MELTLAAFTLGDRREFTGHVRDITERKKAEAALAHEATHDSLTGLPNRGLLRARLEQLLPGARGDMGGPALLLLDLDRFKEVNDTLGHHAGDLLLQEVAARLQGAVSELSGSVHADVVTVARLGGDEFAVLLPGGIDAETAARALMHCLTEPLVIEHRSIAVAASIGVARAEDHCEDAGSVLRRADTAMYTAKRGRLGYVVHTAEQDRHRAEWLASDRAA